MTNSGFLHFDAKFVPLYQKNNENDKICQIITKKVFILKQRIKDIIIRHIFFTFKCEKSVICGYKIFYCGFLSNDWALPPIRYP